VSFMCYGFNMSATKAIHDYALRIPMDKAQALASAKERTGLSVNQLLMLCVDKALSDVVTALAPVKRVTNVDPLPQAELERYYSRTDDWMDKLPPEQIMACQTQEAPE